MNYDVKEPQVADWKNEITCVREAVTDCNNDTGSGGNGGDGNGGGTNGGIADNGIQSLLFDDATGELNLTTVDGSEYKVDLSSLAGDVKLIDVAFDTAANKIKFYMSDASEYEIDISSLVKVKTDKGIEGDGTDVNKIAAKISADDLNIVEFGSDNGIFVQNRAIEVDTVSDMLALTGLKGGERVVVKDKLPFSFFTFSTACVSGGLHADDNSGCFYAETKIGGIEKISIAPTSVSADSYYNDSTKPENMLDGTTDTTFGNKNKLPQSVYWEYAEEIRPSYYSMARGDARGYQTDIYSPKKWKLYGEKDGEWELIDARMGEKIKYTKVSAPDNPYYFQVAVFGSYKKFKLEIIESNEPNNANAYINISVFEFFKEKITGA